MDIGLFLFTQMQSKRYHQLQGKCPIKVTSLIRVRLRPLLCTSGQYAVLTVKFSVYTI